MSKAVRKHLVNKEIEMIKKLAVLLTNISHEGDSLKYTFDNSHAEITLQMVAFTPLYEDSKDYSLFLLRVSGLGDFDGTYSLYTSSFQSKFINYRVFYPSCGDVHDSNTNAILDKLKDADEVYLNGSVVSDLETSKELRLTNYNSPVTFTYTSGWCR